MPGLPQREHLLLMLASVPGLGERSLARLLDCGIPLARLFELPAEELQGRFDLTPRAARALSGGEERLRVRVAPLERTIVRHGIRLLVHGSPGYPAALSGEGADAAPPLFYAHGNLALLERASVAFLCSGGESRPALERVAGLAGACARAGLAVVAGHNRAGYRAAASAAKAAGGPRIIVLDRGILEAFAGDLDRDLFPTARVWGYSFEPNQTLALSPYPLDSPFVGVRNRQRDHLVARLAGQVVAVEIRPGGVMERECRAAWAQGTPVYVCHGPDSPEGNQVLLSDGIPPLPEDPLSVLVPEAGGFPTPRGE